MVNTSRVRSRRRGGILLTTLVFAVIIATILAGLGTLIVSYYSRVTTEAEFASAINLADAGANYELRQLNVDVNSADLPTQGNPPGSTVSLGSGSFRVYCSMVDGVTAWDKQTVPFCIISTGIIGSVSRQIKILATSINPGGTYAVFGAQQGEMDAAPTITQGNVGTNGYLTFNSSPSISGNVIFNGSTSDWQIPPAGTYNVEYKPTAVTWPTVETLAANAFGLQGLAYVASFNDNVRATPIITGTNLVVSSGTQTFVGKAGGANYYLTGLSCTGSGAIAFDNTAGPINIWVGPSGAASTFSFAGGTASVKMSTDPTRPVKVYIATANDVVQNGNSELDAGIYNVNNAGSGRVIINGAPAMYTSIISNMFKFNGAPQVYFQSGYFSPAGQMTYEYDNSWTEVNGL